MVLIMPAANRMAMRSPGTIPKPRFIQADHRPATSMRLTSFWDRVAQARFMNGSMSKNGRFSSSWISRESKLSSTPSSSTVVIAVFSCVSSIVTPIKRQAISGRQGRVGTNFVIVPAGSPWRVVAVTWHGYSGGLWGRVQLYYDRHIRKHEKDFYTLEIQFSIEVEIAPSQWRPHATGFDNMERAMAAARAQTLSHSHGDDDNGSRLGSRSQRGF